MGCIELCHTYVCRAVLCSTSELCNTDLQCAFGRLHLCKLALHYRLHRGNLCRVVLCSTGELCNTDLRNTDLCNTDLCNTDLQCAFGRLHLCKLALHCRLHRGNIWSNIWINIWIALPRC